MKIARDEFSDPIMWQYHRELLRRGSRITNYREVDKMYLEVEYSWDHFRFTIRYHYLTEGHRTLFDITSPLDERALAIITMIQTTYDTLLESTRAKESRVK